VLRQTEVSKVVAHDLPDTSPIASTNNAHHRSSTPSVICAARACRHGSSRALVSNWQSFLPTVADACPTGGRVAADATTTERESRARKCGKGQCKAGQAEGHCGYLNVRK
jgi:hypothetical protein